MRNIRKELFLAVFCSACCKTSLAWTTHLCFCSQERANYVCRIVLSIQLIQHYSLTLSTYTFYYNLKSNRKERVNRIDTEGHLPCSPDEVLNVNPLCDDRGITAGAVPSQAAQHFNVITVRV